MAFIFFHPFTLLAIIYIDSIVIAGCIPTFVTQSKRLRFKNREKETVRPYQWKFRLPNHHLPMSDQYTYFLSLIICKQNIPFCIELHIVGEQNHCYPDCYFRKLANDGLSSDNFLE